VEGRDISAVNTCSIDNCLLIVLYKTNPSFLRFLELPREFGFESASNLMTILTYIIAGNYNVAKEKTVTKLIILAIQLLGLEIF